MKEENIKTTDWLTRGMTKEQIAQKKKAAIEEAERELKERERDIGKEIYELACILYKNIEYNLDWHDCIYLADQAVKKGYRKQVEGEWLKLESRYAHAEGFPPNATDVEKQSYLETLQHQINCSICFSSADDRDAVNWNFCPNCGAKMVSIKYIFNEGGFESQALKGE